MYGLYIYFRWWPKGKYPLLCSCTCVKRLFAICSHNCLSPFDLVQPFPIYEIQMVLYRHNQVIKAVFVFFFYIALPFPWYIFCLIVVTWDKTCLYHKTFHQSGNCPYCDSSKLVASTNFHILTLNKIITCYIVSSFFILYCLKIPRYCPQFPPVVCNFGILHVILIYNL